MIFEGNNVIKTYDALGWEVELNAGATADRTGNGHCATMQFNQAFHNMKTKPCARMLAVQCALDLMKRLSNVGNFFRRYANAVVLHGNEEMILRLKARRYGDIATRRRKLYRIREQIKGTSKNTRLTQSWPI